MKEFAFKHPFLTVFFIIPGVLMTGQYVIGAITGTRKAEAKAIADAQNSEAAAILAKAEVERMAARRAEEKAEKDAAKSRFEKDLEKSSAITKAIANGK